MNPQPKPVPRPKAKPQGLKRKARLRALGNSSHARWERDFPWMGRVKQLPCIARLLTARGNECDGEVHAHHAFGRRGIGRDRATIPLCRKHHIDEWHAHRGVFAGWDKARRRQWSTWAVEFVRLELEGGAL